MIPAARRLQPRQAGLVIDARGDPHRAFGLPHEPGKPLPAHEHGAQAEHAQLRVFRPAEERFAGTIERRVLFVGIPDLPEMPLARAANLLEAGLRQRGRAGRGACRPGHTDQEAERVFGGTHLTRHVAFVRGGQFGEHAVESVGDPADLVLFGVLEAQAIVLGLAHAAREAFEPFERPHDGAMGDHQEDDADSCKHAGQRHGGNQARTGDEAVGCDGNGKNERAGQNEQLGAGTQVGKHSRLARGPNVCRSIGLPPAWRKRSADHPRRTRAAGAALAATGGRHLTDGCARPG